MEALFPSISLSIWTILYIISLGMGIVALTRLYKNNLLDTMSKIIWTIWILSAPILGTLFYYVICEPANHRTT